MPREQLPKLPPFKPTAPKPAGVDTTAKQAKGVSFAAEDGASVEAAGVGAVNAEAGVVRADDQAATELSTDTLTETFNPVKSNGHLALSNLQAYLNSCNLIPGTAECSIWR